MKILKSDLHSASKKQIITSDQADKLWNYFESLRPDQAKFGALHVLYYLGGILILTSMSWFLTKAWDNGSLIMAASAVFAIIYVIIGNNLWKRSNLKVPAGLLITAAVGLVPVFIYGLEKMIGIVPGEVESRLCIEIGTIIAAMIALRFYQFSFITFPMALSLWSMSMDLAILFFGKEYSGFEGREMVSRIFGLLFLSISYFVDKKFKKIDFAFWSYLSGMLTFWVALLMMNRDSEVVNFIYFLLNIGFIILSVYLYRRLFAVFGVIGVLLYIGHLAWVVFKDSYAFPIVLTFLGALIIMLGIKYQRNKDKFESKIEGLLPTFLLKWRPQERV